MTTNSNSLYQGTAATPGSGLVVGQQNGNQVSQVRVVEFTGTAIQSVTNPVGGTALITITANATGNAAFIIFQSSGTPSANQMFSDPNLAAYNNDPTLLILSINGNIATPNVSYTLQGNTITVLDWLDANDIIQVEPNPGKTQDNYGFNYDVVPVFTNTNTTTTNPLISGNTLFKVVGDQSAIFLPNLKIAFQNTRQNGQLYTIQSVTFNNDVTNVNFTPPLLAADAVPLGAPVFLVVGSFSQNQVTDVVLGNGLNGIVNGSTLTIASNLQNRINYDTIPVFTNSNFRTIGSGSYGTTSVAVLGNAVPTLTPQTKITFQNSRVSGQIYTISTSSFTGSSTDVVFSPALQAPDAFSANTIIYIVTGSFTQTSFTDLNVGYGLIGGVDNNGLLTVSAVPTISSLQFDSVPTFVPSGTSTINAGAAQSNNFLVSGNQTSLFPVGQQISFQNTRINGQIYRVSAIPIFSGGSTTVIFSPALANADTYISGQQVYFVSGQFSQAQFTSLAPGQNINGTVSNNILTLNAPISVGLSPGTTGLTVSNSPITGTGTMTIGGTLNVASGGTGLNSIPVGSLLSGNGANNPLFIPPGTSGNVLTSNGSTWSSQSIPQQVFTGTWQDVGGSRSFNTQYTNSRTYPIAVGASTTCSTGSNITAYVGGVQVCFWTWQFNSCLSPDTQIKLWDGSIHTLLELKGQTVELCSLTEDMHVVKGIGLIELTHPDIEVLRIYLSDGTQIVCTYIHKFIMLISHYVGTIVYKQADQLVMGDMIYRLNDMPVMVVKTEYIAEKMDTYCPVMQNHHNFQLANGMMSHNCGSFGGTFVIVPPNTTYQLNSGQGVRHWSELF